MLTSSSECHLNGEGLSFTFFDGLTILVGTRIDFAAEASQIDPNIIKDPHNFGGFRFVDLEKSDAR